MHAEAWDFLVHAARYIHPPKGARVLEFGAHDVNGSPRLLFPDCLYTGVDPWAGAGVDVVSRAQDFDGGGQYDIVISAETMEHDPDPQGQIASAFRALRKGGYFVITAAAEPRAAHKCDGSLGDLNGEPYKNIDPGMLTFWLVDFEIICVQHDQQHGDVYALAVKP